MTLETTKGLEGRARGGAAKRLRFNNISELRLLFAASVMLSHAALLFDAERFRLIRVILNSEAAVQGFFILSGFLVCGSYSRMEDAGAFWKRRFARIYPGYFVAVAFFIALALLQARWLSHAIDWSGLPRYLAANLATLNFLQPTVPGLFPDNSMQPVNGALWSIKVEMMFYAALPFFYWFARKTSFSILALLLIAAGVIYWPLLQHLGGLRGIEVPLSFKFQLPGQLHYFGLGIALFARARGDIDGRTLALLVLACLVGLGLVGEVRQAIQAAVLVAIIGALAVAPQLPSLTGDRDLSYGIYLSHFPIIQILLAGGFAAFSPVLFIVCVVALATIYAMASWAFVEKPTLSLGSSR